MASTIPGKMETFKFWKGFLVQNCLATQNARFMNTSKQDLENTEGSALLSKFLEGLHIINQVPRGKWFWSDAKEEDHFVRWTSNEVREP